MEPERDGVVRNNGPPIIGILKYYALARLLLLRSDPESCWSVRGHIGLESQRSGDCGVWRRPFLLHAARQSTRRAFISRGEWSDLYVGKFVAERVT